jgi:hypothetical protein
MSVDQGELFIRRLSHVAAHLPVGIQKPLRDIPFTGSEFAVCPLQSEPRYGGIFVMNEVVTVVVRDEVGDGVKIASGTRDGVVVIGDLRPIKVGITAPYHGDQPELHQQNHFSEGNENGKNKHPEKNNFPAVFPEGFEADGPEVIEGCKSDDGFDEPDKKEIYFSARKTHAPVVGHEVILLRAKAAVVREMFGTELAHCAEKRVGVQELHPVVQFLLDKQVVMRSFMQQGFTECKLEGPNDPDRNEVQVNGGV